jgi:hypothetical protein
VAWSEAVKVIVTFKMATFGGIIAAGKFSPIQSLSLGRSSMSAEDEPASKGLPAALWVNAWLAVRMTETPMASLRRRRRSIFRLKIRFLEHKQRSCRANESNATQSTGERLDIAHKSTRTS